MIDGRLVHVAGTLLDTIGQHTAIQISCPAAQITTRWILLGSTHAPWQVVFAEGCGERVVYAFEAPYVEGEYLQMYTMSRVSIGRGSSSH
jgi:hypothetical protein